MFPILNTHSTIQERVIIINIPLYEKEKVNGNVNIFNKILKPFIPNNLITDELNGIYSNNVLAEFGEIIKYYDIYENGVEIPVNQKDYVPSTIREKKIRALIDKENRFMWSKSPDFTIIPINPEEKEKADIYQKYIDEVLKKNHFQSQLVKAGKDCFIGKRIAIICNFNAEYGITLNFIPSLEFIYDTDNFGRLNKIVCFYNTNNAENHIEQRINKKKYYMKNGFCYVSEGIYDGDGNLIETIIEDEKTLFEYIPAVVILNDGLLGDMQGQSDVRLLAEYEEYYNKMMNADLDAERNNMSPIKYALDISSDSTQGLSIAPGAFWDLKTDPAADTSGQVGTIESNLSYSSALESTLDRIKNAMYEQLDMPMVSSTDLQGIVTSGKTLKAIYWSLIVRCDEKFLEWKYNLELIIKCLVDGAFYYPEIAKNYIDEKLPEFNYTINIQNQYPIPEDEESEKTIDLAEVSAQTMSKKSYMRKWRGLTEEEAEAELKQLAIERQTLEESYFPTENEPLNTDMP